MGHLQNSGLLTLVFCHLCNVAKMTVIPAEAGIQEIVRQLWIPAFTGMEVQKKG